ncbi:helix-turn-helix transcriptional regulator [Sorangium sp. So ce119]|uniref:helix-turn-helix transcriptional regulator n=1 Tax=Sorangium sp. So ce119 TaxID=3133279 RepID=UPI003F6358BD
MRSSIHLTAREQRITWQLLEILHSSLDLHEVLRGAYGALCQLLPADHGALCVSLPGDPTAYDWAVADLPPELFAGYAALAPHDFVRSAVIAQPNVVLRDSEMLPRGAIERSLMYRRSRELGMRLEQAMAVLLAVEPGWHGGITLYRDRQRPFSDRDRALMQQLAPSIAAATRSCRRFGDSVRRGDALEAALRREGMEVLVVAPPAALLSRSAGAEALLERWFAPVERSASALPMPLADALAAAAAAPASCTQAAPWVRRTSDGELRVVFVPFVERGRKLWVLELREGTAVAAAPAVWRERLTERQVEVAERVLRGWDNALIAEDLACTPATVKKHLQRIYDALGVPSRTALMVHAAQRG